MSFQWSFDGWIVLAGILCAVAASLLGNFLVLRKMSMLGDAISHAILPGLAIAFFLSGSRSSWPMFVGAVLAGVLTSFLTEWIRSFGEVDEGASMGVVFTALFAIGLIMIVQAADHVDLDPGCVLYGAIESIPFDTISLGGYDIPRVVAVHAVVVIVNLVFVVLFFKELKLSSFDPALSRSVGLSPRLLHYVLMTLVAVTCVASFESVGNILVVAMFVVPPATAYLLTDRLVVMVILSTLLAALSAILGHLAALQVPAWFGFKSTTTAPMMAVCAGLLFTLAALFAPQQGVITRWLRRLFLSLRILDEDVVALLYRMEEAEQGAVRLPRQELQHLLVARPLPTLATLTSLRYRGEISRTEKLYELTEVGRERGRHLVRSHRLWEQYLVTAAGIAADRIHDKAERLEHFTDKALRHRLGAETESPSLDPHGSPIPPEQDHNNQ